MIARRLRVLASEADQFPDWWPKTAVQAAFTLVSARPDALVLPMPKMWWREEDFDVHAGYVDTHPASLPKAVYYRFDSWDDPARGWNGPRGWREPLHRYIALADLVAGPTLPSTGGPPDVVPLPYPPLVRRVASPPDLGASTIDLHFAGSYKEPGWAGPSPDTRDRRYRGHLLRELCASLPAERILIRRTKYWNADDQRALRRRYVRELDRSAIVLAPAGFGHLTFRHADAWARGRVVLSEPVQRHLRVPEPERWASGEICLTYDPERDDVVEVVKRALDDPRRLHAVARAGWAYGRRWTDPAAQVAQLAEALAVRLG